MADKPLVWLAGEIKTPPFSREARVGTGVLLRRLQQGENLRMPGFRAMPSVGRRCGELRVPDEKANWRIMLRVDTDAIVILEVFAKKSRTTPARVIETCKRRLRSYQRAIHEGGE
ncbi:MAG: type II toxin-antitoxin system RelE/ParE family toxin [bacterium]|nr:type II toxin-antitoxin system RelE/ParE family toxin [bacterium]